MIKVYDALAREFNTNGLGAIQPIKCIEIKKLSLSGWSLNIEVSADYLDIIKKDNIVVAETKEKGPQPFRIGNPKIKRNVISFTANHVVFDLQKLILSDVRPTDLSADRFLNYLKDRTDVACQFNFSSDISDSKTKYFIRKTMLDALYITEELFNAEYDVDGFNVILKNAVGHMSDTKLIYGKNIEDVEVYEDWSNVCTKVLPVGPDGITLLELYIAADVRYKNQYTSIVEFNINRQTEDRKDKTEEQIILELRQLAKEYLNQNKYPKVNYTLKADIEQTLNVGDIVPVHHPLVTLETRVQEYEYDCNKKQVTKIVYGNFDRTVKKAFDDIKNQIILTENHLKENEKTLNVVKRTAKENSSLIRDTYRKDEVDVIKNTLIQQTEDSVKAEASRIDKIFNEKTQSYDSHFQSVDQKLTPNGITTTVSEAISNDGNIRTTKFTMDKNGFHVKGGGMDISNNAGNKVFKTDTDGNLEITGKVTANNGQIGGWQLNASGLYKGAVKINNSGVTNIYTWADLYIIRLIIMDVVKADADMIAHYDFNGDGSITPADYVELKKRLKAL